MRSTDSGTSPAALIEAVKADASRLSALELLNKGKAARKPKRPSYGDWVIAAMRQRRAYEAVLARVNAQPWHDGYDHLYMDSQGASYGRG